MVHRKYQPRISGKTFKCSGQRNAGGFLSALIFARKYRISRYKFRVYKSKISPFLYILLFYSFIGIGYTDVRKTFFALAYIGVVVGINSIVRLFINNIPDRIECIESLNP